MLVNATTASDGSSLCLRLERDGPSLVLRRDDGRHGQIEARVVIAVMRRYGRAIDDLPASVDEIELEAGVHLRSFRFRAAVDVEGRDYLALLAPGSETIAAMATTIAGALDHLLGREASD